MSLLSKNKNQTHILIILILIFVAIGFTQFLIMQFLPWIQTLFPFLPEALLNAILLSLSITPIIYLLIRKHIIDVSSDESNIRKKLIISAGLPLIIAITLMLNIVHNKQQDISILHNTESIIALDSNIAKLIDALNKELELSALFLISLDEKSAKISSNTRSLDDLKVLRIAVDTLLLSIKKSMTSEDIVVGEFNQQYVAELKSALITLREGIDANNIS
ncbi:hypothetical protein H4J42_13290, partial [Colwellia sp. BRX8-8]|nr:hypothetical protein [Colwellia sp. BRX8-8]